MQAYRLIKKKYADDPLDAQGAKLYGGRWNNKGRAVIYASDSIALAVLEKLVHLQNTDVLRHYLLCEFVIDDDAVMMLDQEALPSDWQADPPPLSTMIIGDEWLSLDASLALAVPSTIVPRQFNLVINPGHPDFAVLRKSLVVEAFSFDQRLVK